MKGSAPVFFAPGAFLSSRRTVVALVVAAAGLAGCSSGSSTAGIAESTVTQFSPVTSPELATTTTTTRSTTTGSPASIDLDGSGDDGGDGDDATGSQIVTESPLGTDGAVEAGAEAEADNLTLIEQRFTAALGPTGSLSTTLDELLTFPVRIATPAESTVVEVAVGVGSLLPRSNKNQPVSNRTIVQVSGTIHTPAAANDALALVGGSLVRAGLQPIDSTSDADASSRSYQLPDAGRFDEVVVTALDQPGATGSLVRVTYNGTAANSSVAIFRDWAGQSLPLPQSDQLRTILTVTRSGEGRLEVTNLTISSAAIVLNGNATREANRLVQRILRAAEDNTSRFAVIVGLEDTEDSPLMDLLRVEGLDEAGYQVVPTQQVDVDSEGELELIDTIEVRLTGSKVLEP